MKYPNGIVDKKSILYGNRGMGLEDDLNITNKYYLDTDKAIIHKKPTPITINKVDYKSRIDAVIKEAHFKIPSTTDYNGIYRGKYIDFEAKETKLLSFPLANIHKHQIDHLIKIVRHGGIGFIIVRFTKVNETYLLVAQELNDFIKLNSRKSIPIEYFKNKGYLIQEKFTPRLDYLKIIDQIYFKGDKAWKRKI